MQTSPPWFRLHLSTAVVLMLGASALLGLNLTRHRDQFFPEVFGWPMVCLRYFSAIKYYDWDVKNVITNVVTGVVLLAVAGIVMEKRIAIFKRLRQSEADDQV